MTAKLFIEAKYTGFGISNSDLRRLSALRWELFERDWNGRAFVVTILNKTSDKKSPNRITCRDLSTSHKNGGNPRPCRRMKVTPTGKHRTIFLFKNKETNLNDAYNISPANVVFCLFNKTWPQMEAAGIEPASRNRSEQASTCVSSDLKFKPISLAAAQCVSVDPKTKFNL
jgi:hypothetical protein